jgi:hypothetical protein
MDTEPTERFEIVNNQSIGDKKVAPGAGVRDYVRAIVSQAKISNAQIGLLVDLISANLVELGMQTPQELIEEGGVAVAAIRRVISNIIGEVIPPQVEVVMPDPRGGFSQFVASHGEVPLYLLYQDGTFKHLRPKSGTDGGLKPRSGMVEGPTAIPDLSVHAWAHRHGGIAMYGSGVRDNCLIYAIALSLGWNLTDDDAARIREELLSLNLVEVGREGFLPGYDRVINRIAEVVIQIANEKGKPIDATKGVRLTLESVNFNRVEAGAETGVDVHIFHDGRHFWYLGPNTLPSSNVSGTRDAVASVSARDRGELESASGDTWFSQKADDNTELDLRGQKDFKTKIKEVADGNVSKIKKLVLTTDQVSELTLAEKLSLVPLGVKIIMRPLPPDPKTGGG